MRDEQLEVLIAERAALDAKIKQAQRQGKTKALTAAAAELRKAGITYAEAAAFFRRGSSMHKVKAKYRHRMTGETWTGRGKKPAWFRTAEPSDIEEL